MTWIDLEGVSHLVLGPNLNSLQIWGMKGRGNMHAGLTVTRNSHAIARLSKE
jgi:hypothetical protein